MRVLKDIEFSRPDSGEPLRLDLYLPDAPGPGDPAPGAPTPSPSGQTRPDKLPPLVIWVYGGGWSSGSKEGCGAADLADKGFVVASISYRLVPRATFPAQAIDCQTAICWLRSHAGQYSFDPARVGLIGISAGGHLVALLGASAPIHDWLGADQYPGVARDVQAVVDGCGPSDLPGFDDPEIRAKFGPARGAVSGLLGGPIDQRLDLARQASPMTYVGPHCPPMLVLHNIGDDIVPVGQGIRFHQALKLAGVDVELMTPQRDEHAFSDPAVPPRVLQFFQRTLQR